MLALSVELSMTVSEGAAYVGLAVPTGEGCSDVEVAEVVVTVSPCVVKAAEMGVVELSWASCARVRMQTLHFASPRIARSSARLSGWRSMGSMIRWK